MVTGGHEDDGHVAGGDDLAQQEQQSRRFVGAPAGEEGQAATRPSRTDPGMVSSCPRTRRSHTLPCPELNKSMPGILRVSLTRILQRHAVCEAQAGLAHRCPPISNPISFSTLGRPRARFDVRFLGNGGVKRGAVVWSHTDTHSTNRPAAPRDPKWLPPLAPSPSPSPALRKLDRQSPQERGETGTGGSSNTR